MTILNQRKMEVCSVDHKVNMETCLDHNKIIEYPRNNQFTPRLNFCPHVICIIFKTEFVCNYLNSL